MPLKSLSVAGPASYKKFLLTRISRCRRRLDPAFVILLAVCNISYQTLMWATQPLEQQSVLAASGTFPLTVRVPVGQRVRVIFANGELCHLFTLLCRSFSKLVTSDSHVGLTQMASLPVQLGMSDVKADFPNVSLDIVTLTDIFGRPCVQIQLPPEHQESLQRICPWGNVTHWDGWDSTLSPLTAHNL